VGTTKVSNLTNKKCSNSFTKINALLAVLVLKATLLTWIPEKKRSLMGVLLIKVDQLCKPRRKTMLGYKLVKCLSLLVIASLMMLISALLSNFIVQRSSRIISEAKK